MNIKIEIIKKLRKEIEKSTINMQQIELEYENICNKINSIIVESKNLNDKYECDRVLFKKECKKVMLRYIWPFTSVLSCGLGIILMLSLYNEIGVVSSSLVSILFTSVEFAVINDLYLSNVDIWYDYENKNIQHRIDRWRNFLFKRHPDLERMFNDLCGLISEISKRKEELFILKNKKLELKSKLDDISNILCAKKNILIDLEGQYMNNILNSGNIEKDENLDKPQVFKKKILKHDKETC